MNILFLCTGNSARSIMAEVLTNDLGGGRLVARSAGSQPAGEVNPAALRQLRARGHPTSGLESKSWDRFAGDGSMEFDAIITVCDNAAGESCPVWPGRPVTAHWGIPDPAAITGEQSEIDVAFGVAYRRLRRRIEALLEVSEVSLNGPDKLSSLQAIHASANADSTATRDEAD